MMRASSRGLAGWRRGVHQLATRATVTDKSATTSLPIVYHPLYSAPQLPAGHRFPMQVFRRIYERLLLHHCFVEEQVHVPQAFVPEELLCLVHRAEYVTHFLAGTLDAQRMRRIGLGEVTRSQVLIDRTQAEVAGTLLTARLALERGLAVNTAGGTHHAFPDAGSGFCILNDLSVTSKVLLEEGRCRRIMILDLDVHQGDGTAVCLADEPRTMTISFHCDVNFPARKQRSTLDVPLPAGTSDQGFLQQLGHVLPQALASFQPDLVLYDAGVDMHEDDDLGHLAITDGGLARREALVFDTCLAAGVPVAGYVGGGYATDLDVLAERHILLHKAAQQAWRDYALA